MVSQLVRNWWAIALRGAAGVLFGMAAFIWPVHTLAFLVWLFGIYVLVDGIFAVVAAIGAASKHERWAPMAFEGVLGIILGLITLFWPGIAVVVLIYYIAAWALLTGALSIWAAVRLRKEIEGEWVLGLSGLISVLLGILLLFMPGAGAIAFLWVAGGYALFFGILLIVLAFRLRGLEKRFTTHAPV